MELADYLVAGLMLVVGFGIGRFTKRRPIAREYVCTSCNHGYGFHGGKSGSCRAMAKFERCRCQHYVGDKPPPSYDDIMKS